MNIIYSYIQNSLKLDKGKQERAKSVLVRTLLEAKFVVEVFSSHVVQYLDCISTNIFIFEDY
jgi:hypothetical protein